MSDHAELAPSGAARWLACTASIAYCQGHKEDDDQWNLEGKAAHEKLELWLKFGVPPTDGLLYEHLEYAFDYALSLEQAGYAVSFEQRVEYDATLWGTVDILGIRRRDLALGDYKHGFRPVEVQTNLQCGSYGVCVSREYNVKFSNVEFAIIQPRISHIDGAVRKWQAGELFLPWLEEEILSAKRRIQSGKTEFVAGKHCKFCPREGDCKTFTNYVSTLVRGSPMFNYFLTEDNDPAEDLL